MKNARKIQKLQRRQAAYDAFMAKPSGKMEGKVRERRDTGGYHRPGSANK